MIIKDIEEKEYPEFRRLFCEYYEELDCEDEPSHLFDEYVLPDLKAELFYASGSFEGGSLTGFIIYQIDDPVNDWNFRDGSGDVRELYVSPAFRGKHYGAELLAYAETALKEHGAEEIYLLPTDGTEDYFIKRGYGHDGAYCEATGNKVYFKPV